MFLKSNVPVRISMSDGKGYKVVNVAVNWMSLTREICKPNMNSAHCIDLKLHAMLNVYEQRHSQTERPKAVYTCLNHDIRRKTTIDNYDLVRSTNLGKESDWSSLEIQEGTMAESSNILPVLILPWHGWWILQPGTSVQSPTETRKITTFETIEHIFSFVFVSLCAYGCTRVRVFWSAFSFVFKFRFQRIQ